MTAEISTKTRENIGRPTGSKKGRRKVDLAKFAEGRWISNREDTILRSQWVRKGRAKGWGTRRKILEKGVRGGKKGPGGVKRSFLELGRTRRHNVDAPAKGQK